MLGLQSSDDNVKEMAQTVMEKLGAPDIIGTYVILTFLGCMIVFPITEATKITFFFYSK